MLSTYGSCNGSGWESEQDMRSKAHMDINSVMTDAVAVDELDDPKSALYTYDDDDEEEEEIDERFFDTMKYEANRLNSFKNKWPLCHIKPEKLAETGFFYLQSEDRVQCAFCHVIIYNWSVGDVALKAHMKKSPRCPFLVTCSAGNVPIIHLDHSSFKEPYHPYPTLSATSAHYKPKHPRMSDIKRRLMTYKDWPLTTIIPQQLSECGLYYTGISDVVTCFFCGGSLGNWDIGDDPWVEHEKFFPSCAFLSLSNSSFRNSSKNSSFRLHGQLPNPSKVLNGEARHSRDSLNSAIIRQALELFPASLVNEVVSKRLSRSGECYSSINELCEEILEHKQTARAIDSSLTELRSTLMVPSESRVEETVVANCAEREILADRNAADALLCKICMDRERAAVFQPCGHLVACQKCAEVVQNCPVCRRPITNIVKIYLS